jgi:hypothetical protein
MALGRTQIGTNFPFASLRQTFGFAPLGRKAPHDPRYACGWLAM